MTHNTTRPTHAENLAKLPPWSDDPLVRLEHTLAAHTQPSRDAMAIYATMTTHPEPDVPAMTGITWGDLEQLAHELRAARAGAYADQGQLSARARELLTEGASCDG